MKTNTYITTPFLVKSDDFDIRSIITVCLDSSTFVLYQDHLIRSSTSFHRTSHPVFKTVGNLTYLYFYGYHVMHRLVYFRENIAPMIYDELDHLDDFYLKLTVSVTSINDETTIKDFHDPYTYTIIIKKE